VNIIDDPLGLFALVLSALVLLFLGSIARSVRRKRHASFSKKILFFPLFVIGIFVIGWFSEYLRAWMYAFLQQSGFTSITGILFTVVVTWFLYSWVFWRR